MQSIRPPQYTPSTMVDTPDLDVTPVMNMFIVLIPFLISMVVFTRMAVLHFTLPPNVSGGMASINERPHVKLTIVIAEDYCAVTYGAQMLDSIVTVEEKQNIGRLAERLHYHRASDAVQHDEVIVAVRDKVAFESVVEVMDICRTAGFTKIGLSNATDDPTAGI